MSCWRLPLELGLPVFVWRCVIQFAPVVWDHIGCQVVAYSGVEKKTILQTLTQRVTAVAYKGSILRQLRLLTLLSVASTEVSNVFAWSSTRVACEYSRLWRLYSQATRSRSLGFFYFSRGSRSKRIVVSEESQCLTARSLHCLLYSVFRRKARGEKWLSQMARMLIWSSSADNNNTLKIPVHSPDLNPSNDHSFSA